MTTLSSYTLITGGAGFIGTNLSHSLASRGHSVLIFDNLSRDGVEQNLNWLLTQHPERIQFRQGDIRDFKPVQKAVANAEAVYHLAAQVAITTSIADPFFDFEVNARGTLNLLEAIRDLGHRPPLIYTSTNRVLSDLNAIELVQTSNRYEPKDPTLKNKGINEDREIEFSSPYGCSKGAAEQYILDYAKNFDIPAIVFRMGSIYGPRQFGTEDQGWIAHFVKQALNDNPIIIYGDGKQVRDVLYIDDLVDALMIARKKIKIMNGQVFNMGGGPQNTLSLLQLIDLIAELTGNRPALRQKHWRPSDQRYFVSDTSRFSALAEWSPKISSSAGVRNLYNWLKDSENQSVLEPTPIHLEGNRL